MSEIVHIDKRQPRGEIVSLKPVKVIQILNPFRPATERKETVLECVPGEYVWQTLERAGITLLHNRASCGVTVNGALLTPEELSTAYTRPGDWITIALGVGGGEWKTLGMIALMAAAAIIPGMEWADMTLAMNLAMVTGMSIGMSTAVMGAAITLAGSLMISALGGLFTSNVSALNATQTYNPTGPSTTAQPGGVIPKGYGIMGWGGNIVSSFVNFDGTQNEYINILVCFGLGVASAIENILVNGKPVFGYRELSTQQRLGTNEQTAIFGFNETVNGYPQDIEMLNADGPIVIPGTGDLTQELQVSVKFPGGLIRYDNNGNPKEVSYAYSLYYSVDNGTGEYTWLPVVAPRDVVAVTTVDTNGFVHYPYWVVFPTDRYAGSMIVYSTDTDEDAHTPGEFWQYTTDVKVYTIDASNSTYGLLETGEWQPYDANNPLQLTLVDDWWSGWRIVSQMTTTPFYDNISIMGLTPGKYATQVTFWGAGPHDQPIPEGDVTDTHYTAQGWLWNINEVEYNDFSYPNHILVGLRCLATTQLSGQNMQIMATVTHDIGEDTTLPPELASFEHDNPAIVAFDIINNPLYGMGLPWSSVDIPAFLTWANFCDEMVTNSEGTPQRRFVFAGVFDQASNCWACLQKVAQMSRSMVIRVGAMYSVAIDAPSEPVQIFTVGNIKEDSLQETWVGLDDRMNLIEVTYADALRSYRSDLPVSVMGASAVNSALPVKTTRVTLLGCTDRDQAWEWAYFQLLSTQTLLRMIQIKCPIEAVTCQVGSVIGVQHDVPQWGWGGRVQPGSTASVVNIDRDDLPAFTAGAGWTISVQHPNVQRGTATITGTSMDSNGESFVTLNAVPSGRLLLMVSASGKTQAKVYALNAPALQNPNFALGNLGWTLGAGWAISGSGAGAGYGGSDSFAIYTGDGSAAMSNDGQVACAPGTSVTASCQVQGSTGATGSCYVQIKFFNAAGTLLSTANGNKPAANATWLESTVTATAPAATAYCTIGAECDSETTGSWSVGGFSPSLSGTLQVSTLGDMAVGQTVTLYDQNVIDLALVASVEGTALTLETSLSQVPVPDSPWVYGQSLGFQPATLFRVTDLKQSSDFEVTIKGLEYNTSIYEDAVPDYGEVVSAPTVNASVSALTLVENFQTANPNNPTVSLVGVGWTNGPNTVGALIYVQTLNTYYPMTPTQGWSLLANVKGTQYSFWAAQDTQIAVQVVGFDNLGNPAPQTTAPNAILTVLGPGGLPPAVTNFALDTANVPPFSQNAPGPTFTWTAVDAVSGYEIRFLADNFAGTGSEWATAVVLADIAPASAAGQGMSWQAPDNSYGTYFLASYQLAPTPAGATTPVTLQNPNFASGNTGWTPTAGASIVAGNGEGGSGYSGLFVSPGSGGLSNNVKIPCSQGNIVTASCTATTPGGFSAQNCVRVNFYNSSNGLISTATGNTPAFGVAFSPSTCAATAPAGTAYAIVDYHVYSASGTANWYCQDFAVSVTVPAPPAYKSSAFTTPQIVVYGTIQDWQPINFGGSPPFGANPPSSVFQLAQTSASTGSAVLLQNPNFSAGNTGWTPQTGWAIVAGAGYNGSPYIATYTGLATDAIVNNQQTPCAAGAVISATCFIEGNAAATGQACVRVGFFNSAGTEILEVQGNNASANVGWMQSRVVATAPANTAYAVVNAAVFSQTAGSWSVGGFTASILPNSLADVPDAPATNRYAATDPTSDQTVNRIGTTTLQFPAAAVTVAAEIVTQILAIAVQSTSTNDNFVVWVTVPYTGTATSVVLQGNIDGGLNFAFGAGGGASPASFHGSISGLSPGSHTINIYGDPQNGSATVAAEAAHGMCLQVAAASGFLNAPTGVSTVVRPAVG